MIEHYKQKLEDATNGKEKAEKEHLEDRMKIEALVGELQQCREKLTRQTELTEVSTTTHGVHSLSLVGKLNKFQVIFSHISRH